MLVFVLLPENEHTAERKHRYSHIECDVVGCGQRSPISAELQARGASLMDRGWFIDGGLHRCPKHYHDEVPPHGPQYRDQ